MANVFAVLKNTFNLCATVVLSVAIETYPALPNPVTVDVSCDDEMYPLVAKPLTVL